MVDSFRHTLIKEGLSLSLSLSFLFSSSSCFLLSLVGGFLPSPASPGVFPAVLVEKEPVFPPVH